MKISLLVVRGYYNIFEGDSKTKKFKLEHNLLEKIIDMFDHIGKILYIDLYHYSYDDNNGITYFKTKASDETYFRKDKDKPTNTIPDEKTNYNCRVLLQIQFVYYNNKDILEDEDYYPQIFLQVCRYNFLASNSLIYDTFDFKDTEPESESEEEFNEDTV